MYTTTLKRSSSGIRKTQNLINKGEPKMNNQITILLLGLLAVGLILAAGWLQWGRAVLEEKTERLKNEERGDDDGI